MLSSAMLPLALLLLGVAALIIAHVANRQSRSEIDHRISLVASPGSGAPTDALGALLQALPKELDTRVRGAFAFGARRSWGMQSGAMVLSAVAAISAGLMWFLLHVLLGLSAWTAAPLAAVALLFGPRALLTWEQQRAERQFAELFPDALDTTVRILRAGLPITAGLRFISTTAAPPLNAVFAMIADHVDIGIPVEEVLNTSSREVGLADFRFFAVAVVLQRATGGNLASTLEILSDIIRKRRAVRLKARAATGEVRVSAYVLGALPFVAIGALLMLSPDYLTPLFADARGNFILGLAAGSELIALVIMRQMIRSVTTM